MLNRSTVLAMTAAPLREALRAYGIDFEALARRAGLDPALLATPNARYPVAAMQHLWVLAATATGDPLFGFRVGESMRPGMLHALGLGIVSSSSVLEALRRIERYSGIVSTNGRVVVVQHAGLVGLETRPGDLSVMPTTHCVDALVVGLTRILEQCAGPAAHPARVVFMRPRVAPAETYEAILGCPVAFDGDHIAILFDAASAAEPTLEGNAELAAEADRIAARYLESLVPESTAASVRSLLLKAMSSGEVDQDGIARRLNQSPSTLQRRLRREGTTYQSLLDATRRELALDYLRQGRHSLADITFLLGFADQSNFTRAFRRWTGKTPRQYLS
jgi:AraC-like DNA-binding protein